MLPIKRIQKTAPPLSLSRFSILLFLTLMVLVANIVAPRWQVVEAQASCAPSTVPGTSDIYLAGMPNGSTADRADVAPAQSPVLANGAISAGATLEFRNVSGTVTHGPNDGCCDTTGPEGGFITGHDI